jgi:hypothetical protein
MAPYTKVLPVKELIDHLDEHFDALAENGGVILIEREGVLYRIELATSTRQEIWSAYDADRAKEALEASAGVLKGVDLEELKRDLRAARGHDLHD